MLNEETYLLEGAFPLQLKDVEGREYVWIISDVEVISRGSSCVCYSVCVQQGQDPGQKNRMILKQFLPDPVSREIQIRIEGLAMTIIDLDQRPDITECLEDFLRAYDLQRDLANDRDLKSVVVSPYISARLGDAVYILYEANNGRSMNFAGDLDPFKAVLAAEKTARALGKLHEKGILLMDLKPENVLWVDQDHVKFFDFDASIRLEEPGLTRPLKGNSGDRIRYMEGGGTVTAPEILTMRDSTENRKRFLTVKADLFSNGAMLFRQFMGRYPGRDDCRSSAFVEDLFRRLSSEERFRKKMNGRQQEMLRNILHRSICASLRDRYASAGEMERDLKTLRLSLEQMHTEAPEDYTNVNFNLLAGKVVYENAGVIAGGKAERTDVMLVGTGQMQQALFSQIFACAQMPGRDLRIWLAAPDASASIKALYAACPLFKDTSIILENGKRVSDGLSRPDVTGIPFAEIRCLDTDLTTSALKALLDDILQSEKCLPTTFLIAEKNEYDLNEKTALFLADYLSGRPGGPWLIGYGGDRGDGFDLMIPEELKALEKSRPDLMVRIFGCNQFSSKDEKIFGDQINSLAFRIHTMYTREYAQRKPVSEIKTDYLAKHYNMRSSLRTAVSIPYKLLACGISPDNPTAPALYYRSVLASDPSARKRLGDLMWLEHRSWMAFMILEGYDHPDRLRMEDYMYRVQRDGDREVMNDQRDQIGKWHPCLTDSDPDQGMRLKDLPHDRWTLEGIAEKEGLDRLDAASIMIHQICSRRTEEVDLRENFRHFRTRLRESGRTDYLIEMVAYLERLYEKMKSGVTNLDPEWEEVCRKIRIRQEEEGFAEPCLKEIGNAARVIRARNQYHDYKDSDLSIVTEIPWLLSRPFKRIYKPVSPHIWQDAFSSILVEPEVLYLVLEGSEEYDCDRICRRTEDFLRTSRGLEKITVTSVDCRDPDLETEDAVVDLTGSSQALQFILMSREDLRDLPWILCENELLRTMTRDERILYYVQKRSLSVTEVFRLAGAEVSGDHEAEGILLLEKDHERLWDIYRSVPFESWQVLTGFFAWYAAKERKENEWRISVSEEAAPVSFDLPADGRDLRMAGIPALLEELRIRKAVLAYAVPSEAEYGLLRIKTRAEDLERILQEILERASAGPGGEYRIRPEGKGLVITRQIRSLDMTLSPDDYEGDLFKLREAMEIFLREGRADAFYPVIYGTTCSELTPEGLHLAFRFTNPYFRECFETADGVLRLYVYHTIRRYALMDDIRMNVGFIWNKEVKETDQISSEIDMVGTKGLRSFFIACMHQRPDDAVLREIKYYADYFGVDARAIVICSDPGITEEDRQQYSRIMNQSRQMNVHFINRQQIDESLAEALREIVRSGETGR